MPVLEPKDLSGSYQAKLNICERRVADFVRLGGQEPGDEISMGVLQTHLAPGGKERLIEKAAELQTYAQMKQTIDEWLIAHEGSEVDGRECFGEDQAVDAEEGRKGLQKRLRRRSSKPEMDRRMVVRIQGRQGQQERQRRRQELELGQQPERARE